MRGFARCAAAMVAAAALAACSGGDDPDVQPIEPTTEPTAQAAPEPTEPEDPYAIPDEIDVEYVQSVVDAILTLPTPALLEAYRTAPHEFPPDDLMTALRSSRSPEVAAESAGRYVATLADQEASAEELEFLESLDEPRWRVEAIDVAEPDCVVFQFRYPETGDIPEGRGVLIREPGERDPEELNPTPWVLDRSGPRDSYEPQQLAERCSIDQLADDEGSEEAP